MRKRRVFNETVSKMCAAVGTRASEQERERGRGRGKGGQRLGAPPCTHTMFKQLPCVYRREDSDGGVMHHLLSYALEFITNEIYVQRGL